MARVPPNLDKVMNEGIAFIIDRFVKSEIPKCPIGQRPVMIGRRKRSYDTLDKVKKWSSSRVPTIAVLSWRVGKAMCVSVMPSQGR